MGTMVCTCAKVPTSHSCWSLIRPPKSDSTLPLPEGLLAVPSGLLLEASDMLEVEEKWDAVSASADGTEEVVLAAALSDDGEPSESEVADSEAADSAEDMPSDSSEGCHMNAPTYACALQQECKARSCRADGLYRHAKGSQSQAQGYKLLSMLQGNQQCIQHAYSKVGVLYSMDGL